MIRKKIDPGSLSYGWMERTAPYSYHTNGYWDYPLNGGQQIIIDNRPSFVKTPIGKRVRRVHRDGVGNMAEAVKRKKISKNAWRLQPYVMNPVQIEKFSIKCDVATVSYVERYGRVTVKGFFAATDSRIGDLSQPVPVNPDAATETRAIIKCLEKLSSPRVLDLGVGLAELSESAKFLARPLDGIVKLFRKHRASTFERLNKVKRKRIPTAREFVDAASSTWLGYRYGFSPMASDVAGIMIEMTEKLDTSSKVLRRVSGRSKSLVMSDPVKSFASRGWQGNDYLYIFGDVRRSQLQTVTAVQLYQYRPYFEDAIKLASLGLSPTQVVSLGWEKVPFSFVVDWGLDVSGWLRAWEPKPWIKYHGSCVSTKTDTVITVSDCRVAGNSSYWVRQKVPDCFCQKVQLIRVVKELTPPKTPPITREVLNLSRTLDSLSLGWGFVSSWLQNFNKRK